MSRIHAENQPGDHAKSLFAIRREAGAMGINRTGKSGKLCAAVIEGLRERRGMMTAQNRHYALGRLPVGVLNKTEAAYEGHLRTRQISGDVAWYKFEGVKLRLADNTFYTPDFFVMTADRHLECHEVKGRWEDDARVKIKVAASLYPFFRFIAVTLKPKKEGGGWTLEEF
jgi:hypothetical protein